MSSKDSSPYPSVSTFFAKAKNQHDFSDKNQFINNKLDQAIQNTLHEPSQNEQYGITAANDDQNHSSANDKDKQILILTEKKRALERNLKSAKILLRKASDLNLQKDLEIKFLQQQLTKKKTDENNDTLFQEHSHRFDSDEIKCIRSIKAGKKNDSAFILFVLKCLYKSEEAKLNNRRVTTRKYGGTQKIELSAEKKQIMQHMLEERVLNELKGSDGDNELKTRLKQLNTHMRNALHNSVTANKKKSSQSVSTSNQKDQNCSQTEQTSMHAQSQTIPIQQTQSIPVQYTQTSQQPRNDQHQQLWQYPQYPYMMQQSPTMPYMPSTHSHPFGYMSTPCNYEDNTKHSYTT